MVLTVALMMAAMLVVMAAPALAKNSGNQPPGPPFLSGNPEGTRVAHCAAFPDGEGATVTHPDGRVTGGGNCQIGIPF